MFRHAVAVSGALVLPLFLPSPAPLSAQEAETDDKVPPAWFVRVEGGAAKIHDRDPSSVWLGARFGRKIPRNGIARWDVGIAGSGADEGFFTFTGGVELQPFPRFVVSPVIRTELGLLVEPEFGGFVYAGQFGLAINPARLISLRGIYQIAGHGGVSGPDGFLGAIEFRWGR